MTVVKVYRMGYSMVLFHAQQSEVGSGCVTFM